jgi:predicted RND superfamily exporter protein
LMYPVAAPEEGRAARRTMRFLDRCRDNLMQRNPAWRELVEIEFSGSHATTVAHLDRMRHDLRLIFKLSPPLAILLLLLVFRKLEVIFFIALPPVLGLLWTLGMASWAFGEISVVTAALLLMNFAIGLQYNLHLYHRFTLELYRTQNYYRALTRSHQETGRGVLASAVVVALLFTLLFATSQLGVEDWRGLVHNLSDARGFGQLGLVAAGGILLNLAACLLTIPALAAIKHLLARGRIKPVGLFHFHLSRLYEPALSKPRAMLGVMLLISVFLGYRALELEFRPRFAAISPFFFRTEPAEEIVAAETSVPRPGRPIIALVNGPSLQEVLERNDRLYKNLRSLKGSYNILAYDSLRTTLPSIRSQIASLDELAQLDLKPLSRATQKASRSVGLKPTVYEPFLEALRSFKEQAATPDVLDFTLDEDDVFIATVQRYITHKASKRYYVATAIYPHANGFNPWRIRPLEEELRSGVGELEFIGDPVFERALSRLFKFNLAIMILLSAVTIAVALVLHFHGLRVALLTFVPILAAIIWVCGLMSLAGLGIHFFTILPIPLLLSLGMDNALQLTQYLDDRRPCTVRQAMASVGRVPVLTCGMMALLLGTLSLASHPGLRNFGQVVLMGSGAVLIATVMLQPALLQLLGKGQSWRGALGVEEDNSGEP